MHDGEKYFNKVKEKCPKEHNWWQSQCVRFIYDKIWWNMKTQHDELHGDSWINQWRKSAKIIESNRKVETHKTKSINPDTHQTPMGL